MKRQFARGLSLLLTLALSCGPLAACTPQKAEPDAITWEEYDAPYGGATELVDDLADLSLLGQGKPVLAREEPWHRIDGGKPETPPKTMVEGAWDLVGCDLTALDLTDPSLPFDQVVYDSYTRWPQALP